ncbi:hypothetical protein [Cylindrospermum sp. FACHB-282]|uniref:hypothetical protein n=1 Tax=Cylindrospermum sp. FACHB-282 TaxID=2692794 RepID=UPI0016843456|nr:hypothetical protein [Cylindrospermum sp. FACHB-282]MBD2388125.1 hypothetical protein [Cylindrospermum sp. FACHB-282]
MRKTIRNDQRGTTTILGIFSLILALSGCFTPAAASVYYVEAKGSDQGQGTQSSPWRTVNKALRSVPPDQGHTIRVGHGSFDLGGKVSVPSGINLIGSGVGLTIIRGEIQLIGVKNLTISDIKFNGKNHTYELGMYIRDANSLLIHNLAFNAYTKTAINIERVADSKINNIDITDSTYNNRIVGGGGKQSYAIGLGNLTNVDFHDINIDTTNRGGQGIHTINDAWPKDKPWSGKPTVLKNIKLYNLDIKVDKWNAWGNGWTPQMALELWHYNCYNCEIFNSTFNSTVSLSSFPTEQPTTIRVHHNLWYGPKNSFYACEVASNNIEFDHNYIRGGSYPIALFGSNYQNINVHHNIFENTKSPTLVGHFKGQINNFQFVNNTVYINESKDPLFRFIKGERANQRIRNNIFYNSSGKMNNLLGASVGIENNLFVNIRPVGSHAMSFNPKFRFEGSLPSPYYMPKQDSRVVNLGAILSGTTVWSVGKNSTR